MRHEQGGGVGEDRTGVPGSEAFHEVVVRAMIEGMHTADGEPVTATVDPNTDRGETKVRYQKDQAPLGDRSFRIDASQECPVVELLDFRLHKYELLDHGRKNAIALHERFLRNLADVECLLWARLTGDDGYAWAPYYDWAPDLLNANAASLRAAVEWIAEATRSQDVWDASNLAERILGIAAASGASAAGHATWADLIRGTTPARLHAGLDAIHDGLGKVIFQNMSVWFGERAVPGSPHLAG